MADVVKVLGSNVTSLSKRRAELLAKGMMYSPHYGELAFTVSMLGPFMHSYRKYLKFSREMFLHSANIINEGASLFFRAESGGPW